MNLTANKKLCLLPGVEIKSISQTKISINNAIAFDKMGYDVTILFHSKAEEIVLPSNINVKYLPRYLAVFDIKGNFARATFGYIGFIFYLTHLLFNKYDVIFTNAGHRPSIFIPTYLSKKIYNTLIVTEWWEWYGKGGLSVTRQGIFGKIIGFYDNNFELRLMNNYDVIIAISNGLKNRLQNHNNIVFIPGAIDSKLESYSIKSARERVKLSSNSFIIGLSGISESDEQDNEPLFKAMSYIIESNNSVYLLLSGNKDYIVKLCLKYNIEKYINVGWVSYQEYNYYLSSCNIFVLPYPLTNRNIGRWPNKIGDYIKIRRPIISNPTGDMDELFNKNNIGRLIKNDISEYVETISDIINNGVKTEIEDFIRLEKELSFSSRCKKINDLIEGSKLNEPTHTTA